MIVGSNVFNLAAMLGVSALLVGSVRVPRNTLIVEGTAGLAVTVTVIAVLLGWLPALAAVVLLALIVAPYLALVLGGPAVRGSLARGVAGRPSDATASPPERDITPVRARACTSPHIAKSP